ncbi:MAG: hypothetical protein IJM25_00610 [Eubacterium sp.]|nr:hypothetical protein [Eubacterium sp.]
MKKRCVVFLLILFLLALSTCGKSKQDSEDSVGKNEFIERLKKKTFNYYKKGDKNETIKEKPKSCATIVYVPGTVFVGRVREKEK